MDIKKSSDLKKPKVLITGASGHLGMNICTQLWNQNLFYIKAGLRSTNTRISKISHETCCFDVRNYDDFYNAAKDVDYIIHLAASFDHSDSNKDSTIETSKLGSENLIKIAKLINFKKIIYTSSVAVCGVNKSSQKMLESTNNITDIDLEDPYIKAKVISHNLIDRAMRQHSLPILILMPSAIIGHNDFKLTPSNSLISKLMNFPFNRFYINVGFNIISINDVVNAHCIGLTNSAVSEKYILSGYNVTIKDLVSLINISKKSNHRLFLLPKNIILFASIILLPFVKLLRIHLPISFFQINNRLNTFGFFDNTKFLSKWKLSLTSLDATISETISWIERRKK